MFRPGGRAPEGWRANKVLLGAFQGYIGLVTVYRLYVFIRGPGLKFPSVAMYPSSFIRLVNTSPRIYSRVKASSTESLVVQTGGGMFDGDSERVH